MDFENINIWYWLITALVGLVCGIIGYYWGRGSVETIDNFTELKLLRDKNSKLQGDLDACNKKLIGKLSKNTRAADGDNLSSSLGTTATNTVAKSTEPSFDAAAAKIAFGKTIKEDDLKVIEGIGPKISGMFHAAGITTWKALSETSVANGQEILSSGGDRYKIHDPASWPMQAKMCCQGKWKELFRWQKEHAHGKL